MVKRKLEIFNVMEEEGEREGETFEREAWSTKTNQKLKFKDGVFF